MNLVQEIQTIAESLNYSFQYEEAKMMNVQADNQVFPCVFFEEVRNGKYLLSYGEKKQTKVNIYFMKLCQMQDTAVSRETIRNTIDSEAVIPFIKAIQLVAGLEFGSEFLFDTPPPRFDSNEVSIMLSFDVTYRVYSCPPIPDPEPEP